MLYLFTDIGGRKVVDIKTCIADQRHETNSRAALAHKALLEKKLKIEVVAWAHMGGDNPYPHS